MSENLIIIRPSFMKFCKDGCKAAVFNHLLYWIGRKNKDQAQEVIQSGEITYFATTEELTKLMANAWSDKKVRTEVNALVEMGLVGRGRNPKWGADRTKHFYFTKEQYTKLIELCKEHQICLAHMELPKEIVNLLAAFDKSIECPCTGQVVNLPYQTENIPNANGKYSKCSDQKQTENIPNANGKYSGAITKVSTKVSKTKISNERMNEASAREVNVSTEQESSHSSIHSSLNFSSSLSSQETREKPSGGEKREVEFSPEAEQVYQLLADLDITYLKRNEEHRDNCMLLVNKGVTTVEKLKSLMQECWKLPHLKDKALNLKNLINALPGWSQIQEQKKKPVTVGNLAYQPFGRDLRAEHAAMVNSVLLSEAGQRTHEQQAAEEERKKRILEQDAKQGKPLSLKAQFKQIAAKPKTEDDIKKKLNFTCQVCRDSNNEMYLEEVKRLQEEFVTSNDDLYESIRNSLTEAVKYSKTSTGISIPTMSEFLSCLRAELSSKANEKAMTALAG